MVGDSVSDIEFAHCAGVSAIGYAMHSKRGREPAAGCADAITHSMAELAGALREA